MRDVNGGWLIRYMHANGASFFFICLYLHIAKGLYYGSYKAPRTLVWVVGVIIFIATIATAFMGYTNINSPKSKLYIYKPYKFKLHNFKSSNFYIQKRYMSYSKDITNPESLFNEICIKPEVWWENLDKREIKDEIRNELKNKSGIYIIINKISKNYYVGSAQTNNLYSRFHNHLYTTNKKGSKIVHHAVNKYGLNNFIFAILEYYPFEVNKYNNEELLALETSYISLLLPKYNIMTEAGQFFGYKNKEINFNNKLNLIKLSLSEERKKLLKKIKYIHTKELVLLRNNHLSNISKKRTYDYWTKEGIENISKGSSKIIYLSRDISISKHKLCEFKNINTISHYLCCSTKTIQRSLHLGFIYVPDVFLPFLNQHHIDNNNSIKEFIDQSKLYLYSYKKNKSIKIRASLCNYKHFTKLYISSKLY